MKGQEVEAVLKEMQMGDFVEFSTQNPNEFVRVERVLIRGLENGWVVDHQGEQQVMNDLAETVQYIIGHWNVDLKGVMGDRFSEMDEMEDMGTY